MGFVLKLEVPSDPRVLSIVRSTVHQLACVAGFPEEQCRSITLAVDEALSNIIRHAYQNRRDQAIQLTCQCDNDGLEFLLVDHGQSVDPGMLRGRPLDEVRPGGLGTHLIAQIMDRVQYEPLPDRNQLRLVKHLSKKSPAGE